MGAADFQPGDYVAHPMHGACRVVGVGDVSAAGETFAALTLEPLAHCRAVVRVPVSKLSGACLRVVTAADAQAMLATWEPPRGKWNHVPVNVQRARRIAHLRSFRASTG